MSTIHEKLVAIQSELKAPKGQTNTFGKYKYRSCEDILEALKPLLKENGCTLTLSDEVVMIGSRFYVKTTASLDCDGIGMTGPRIIQTHAYAREEETRKGMDSSQITGAASSYARKYALNGLFCIDDTKDADTMDNTKHDTAPVAPPPPKKSAPDVRLIMEALTPCKDVKNVETIWNRAMAHKWTTKELADLTECKTNVLARIESKREAENLDAAAHLIASDPLPTSSPKA